MEGVLALKDQREKIKGEIKGSESLILDQRVRVIDFQAESNESECLISIGYQNVKLTAQKIEKHKTKELHSTIRTLKGSRSTVQPYRTHITLLCCVNESSINGRTSGLRHCRN